MSKTLVLAVFLSLATNSFSADQELVGEDVVGLLQTKLNVEKRRTSVKSLAQEVLVPHVNGLEAKGRLKSKHNDASQQEPSVSTIVLRFAGIVLVVSFLIGAAWMSEQFAPEDENALSIVSHDEDFEGENPIFKEMETPWANSGAFVVDAVCLSVIASLVGAASEGYTWITGDLLEKWLSASGSREYPQDLGCIEMFGGAPAWIFLCWAGCTAVGFMKVAFGLDAFPSFIIQIRSQHVDPKEAWKVCICCMGSLLSGCAMGPEAGLASAGGGFGTLVAAAVAKYLGDEGTHDAHARSRLYVIGGIVASFGTIMPAPWVAMLMGMECSFLKNDTDGLELRIFGRRTFFLLGVTATVAYVVRYAVKQIPATVIPGMILDQAYENDMLWKAVMLGAIGAISALLYFGIIGITKTLFGRIASRVERRLGAKARIVIMCSLAGLLTGIFGYAVPLSLTDGKTQIQPTISHAPDLSTKNLVAIAFTKAASYGFAAAGGMVGGPFFPITAIGVVVGELAARIGFLHVQPSLAVPIMLVSMQGAAFPIPLTLVALSLSLFNISTKWAVCLFVGLITSYTLVVGSGLLWKLEQAKQEEGMRKKLGKRSDWAPGGPRHARLAMK